MMFWWFAGFAGLVLFVWKYCLYSPERRITQRHGAPPSFATIMARGLLRSPFRSQGKLSGTMPVTAHVWNVRVEESLRHRYEKETVFAGGEAEKVAAVPREQWSLCYPEVLGTPFAAWVLSGRGFPLSTFGIIHIAQKIVQYEELSSATAYQLVTVVTRTEPTEKGIVFQMTQSLKKQGSGAKGAPVWVGTMTLLSRSAATRSGKRRQPAKQFEIPKWDHQMKAKVAGNQGIRYGHVSGDYNPHHLVKATSMLLGYKRPIAQGMWTLSCAVHELEARNAVPKQFPRHVECEWKKPLFMPGEITFGYREADEQGVVHWGVYDKDNVNPHAIGKMYAGGDK